QALVADPDADRLRRCAGRGHHHKGGHDEGDRNDRSDPQLFSVWLDAGSRAPNPPVRSAPGWGTQSETRAGLSMFRAAEFLCVSALLVAGSGRARGFSAALVGSVPP